MFLNRDEVTSIDCDQREILANTCVEASMYSQIIELLLELAIRPTKHATAPRVKHPR
jgi:hypothetical protein